MQTSTPFTIELHPSGQRCQVDLSRIEASVIELLELYAEPPIVEQRFCELIGDGDGRSKLKRLLEATACRDTETFLIEVLQLLARAPTEVRHPVVVGGVELPYRLSLAILEHLVPGEEILDFKKVRRLERLTNVRFTEAERAQIQEVLDRFPVRLSSHTIRQMRLSPAVAYQYMPFLEELDPNGLIHTWVGQFHRGVIEQMYCNRVIFILNMSCPVYCRFCFRKHKECRTQRAPTQRHVSLGLMYIKSTPEIKEVVLTGGDPFMNRPTLTWAVDGLRDIAHIETIRIATRSLSYHPALMTARDGFWLDWLRRKQIELGQKGKRLEVATHFIHPDELSIQSLDVISELVGAGVPVYVQTPFLGGCNDSGPALTELFAGLRGAGAEIHYIFMPCSPLQGNSMYSSSIADGFEAMRFMRAHLSDRAIPHLCTATSIGKVDWGSNGWVVELDEEDERFVWIRTPYSQEYFERFAPILNLPPVARLNSEGTLDARFMVDSGASEHILGPREAIRWSRPSLDRSQVPAELTTAALAQARARARQGWAGAWSIVDTGIPALSRVHETRVELDCDADDEVIDQAIQAVAADRRISDVVLHASDDISRSFARLRSLLDRLAAVPSVTAVRLISPGLTDRPDAYSDSLIKRLGSCSRPGVVRPQRLELEVCLLHPSDLEPIRGTVIRALRQRGVSIYANIPLLTWVNDGEDELEQITAGCRRVGIEVHQLYLAGHPLQQEWAAEHPVHAARVLDLSSHLRRVGSGRELPRYIIRTPLGEVDLGTTCDLLDTSEHGSTRIRLRAYDLAYYRGLDPGFEVPEGVELDEDDHPIVTITGLVI